MIMFSFTSGGKCTLERLENTKRGKRADDREKRGKRRGSKIEILVSQFVYAVRDIPAI